MRASDLKLGDTVYWGTDGKGVVQSTHGIYANIRVGERILTKSAGALRKKP